MSIKLMVLSCLLAVLIPQTLWAHSPIAGIGDFYNGLLHPVFVPLHLLLLSVVGLFFGQQDPKRIELALVVFAAAVIAGLIAAWFTVVTDLTTFVLVLSASIGLLIALNPQLPLFWCMLIALLAGFFLGVDSAQEELSGKARMVALLGSGIAICLLTTYPMALANYVNKKAWQKIGVRIVGSWAAASSLLVLSLSLSNGL